MTFAPITGALAARPWSAFGRFLPVVTGRKRPRLCKNAGTVLKSASLRKICQ